MTPLAAPLATFLFFSSLLAAQVSAPVCTVASGWMLNSLGQNPCLVAAYLGGVCSIDGSFTISALRPGYSYAGPSGFDDSDLCKCNTVLYSLISACATCQGGELISWLEFSLNCTITWPPSSFPYSIPSGTRVPQWALIDITSENMWDSNKSFAVGDSPELAPGSIPGPSGPIVPASGTAARATSSLFSLPSSTVNFIPPRSSTSQSSSDKAATIGCSVGVVIAVFLAIVVGFFLQRRRSEAPGTGSPRTASASRQPMDKIQRPSTMHDGYTTSSIPVTSIGSSVPRTPANPMRDTPVTPTQGAVPSHNGTGNSPATMQTSLCDQGHHELPID